MSTPITRRTALGVFGAATGTAVLPLTPATAATAADPDVTLVDNGTSVTLANGIISFTVVKATAEIINLILVGSSYGYEKVNLLPGGRSHGYTTFNYTGASSSDLKRATYRLVSSGPDRVEISVRANDPALQPVDIDIRFALERGSSGLYSYWIMRYPQNMPDGLAMGQMRYAFATGTDASFRWFVVDDARGVQQRPSIADLAAGVTLQDSTVALPDGSIYSKYQNSSELEGDNHVFLMSNGKVALSLVQASKEAFGGPTRQELTVHDYYDGEILHWHPLTGHYGMPDTRPEKGWEKVYGPFFLHVGEAPAGDERKNVSVLWKEAKKVAARERAAWPYTWVSDPLYAADQRSTVTGALVVPGLAATKGWAVLYRPGPDRDWRGNILDGDDWQYLSLDYVYSAPIGRDGRFSIPSVRPGTYTLAAFVDGAMGEYRRANIAVAAGRTVRTGVHAWRPPLKGVTLWQIGTPNRSAGEFHIPDGPDGYRTTLSWLEYPYDFPTGVDFTIGKDDPVKDWNYFQPVLRTPGTPAQLAWRGTTPDPALTEWKIRFRSLTGLRGQGYLDIALAGSVFGSLAVTLNGSQVAAVDPLPGVAWDNSTYRQVIRSMYTRIPTITFPATLIKRGENVLTLVPLHPGKAPTADNWMEPMSGLVYDAIRLGVGP